MPQHLDQAAAAPAEHKQVPAMRITCELLLDKKSKARKALAHIRVPRREPDLCAARDRHHGRGSTTERRRANTPVSIPASTRRTRPPGTSISIRCNMLAPVNATRDDDLHDAAAATLSSTAIDRNTGSDPCVASDVKSPKLRRQLNS